MKARFLVRAITLPFLATAAPALAAERSEACSNESLKGRYGVTTHGVTMGVYDKATPPAIHYYETPVKVDLVSAETFDGRGHSTFSYLGFSNGAQFSTPSGEFNTGNGTGAYTVNGDCTGFVDVAFPNQNFPNNRFEFQRAFVLSNDGKTVHMLWTEVHFPNIAQGLPDGVTCGGATGGCDLAVQTHSDGERY
jgi:hypothetical protein